MPASDSLKNMRRLAKSIERTWPGTTARAREDHVQIVPEFDPPHKVRSMSEALVLLGDPVGMEETPSSQDVAEYKQDMDEGFDKPAA